MQRGYRSTDRALAHAAVLGCAFTALGGGSFALVSPVQAVAWLAASVAGAAAVLCAAARSPRRKDAVQPTPSDHPADLRRRFDEAMQRVLRETERLEEHRARLNDEVRRRTTELLKSQRTLERESKARDEFVSLLAHELRTPLTSIRSYLELLRHYGDDLARAERDEFLDIVCQQVTRVGRLVDELLDLSRLRAGRFDLSLQEFDAAETCRQALRAISEVARANDRTLELTCPTSLPVYGDPLRLEQILTNLVSNAIKYAGDSRAVRVRAGRRGDDLIEISVEDDGPGIPAADRERVFEPFYQTQTTKSSDHSGAGLGLYLSRQLARRMGGDITASESPAGGARLTVVLPVSARSDAPTDPVEASRRA